MFSQHMTLLLAFEDPSAPLGQGCAAFAIFLLLVAALFKSIKATQRPKTNKLCGSALALVFGAWLIANGNSMLVRAIGDDNPSLKQIFMMTGSVVAILTLLTSIILAISGLIVFHQQRERYTGGRGMAIWALVLNGLIIAAIIVSIPFIKSMRQREAMRPLIEDLRAPLKARLDFDEYNFQLITPPTPWVKIDVKKISPFATVGFMRGNPQIMMLIIAEKGGVESPLQNEGLAEVVKANIRQGSSKCNIGDDRSETVAGIDGLRFDSTVTLPVGELAYTHWVACHNGYAWQLITYGPAASKYDVHEAMRILSKNFKLLDPQRQFSMFTGDSKDAAPAVTDANADPNQPQGKVYTFEDLNFRIHDPGTPWVEFNAKQFMPEATISFMRNHPQIFGVVIAEKVGAESEIDSVSLAEISRANLRQRVTNLNIGENRIQTFSGIAGIRFDTTGETMGREVAYSHWVTARGGFLWQIIMSGLKSDADEIKASLDKLVSGFELIDPDLQFDAASIAVADIEAPQFGYRIALAQSGWTPWKESRAKVIDAHSALLLGATHVFLVIPLRMDGFEPTELELCRAFIFALNIEDPTTFEKLGTKEIDGVTAIEYGDRLTKAGRTFDRRLYVLKHQGFAYGLVGWYPTNNPAYQRKLDELLTRVKWITPATETDSLNTAEKQSQAHMFDRLTYVALNQGQHDRAIQYCRHAFACNPDEVKYLIAAATLHQMQEQNEAAATLLEAHADQFPNHPELTALRAYVQALTGQVERGITLYAETFKQDYYDEFHFDEYIRLLRDNGRSAEALTAVEQAPEIANHRSLMIHKAAIYRDLEEYDQSLAIFDELAETTPNEISLIENIALTQFLAQRHEQTITTCQQAVDNGVASALIYRLKGGCEAQLERYADAKASYEQVVRLDPTDADARFEVTRMSGLLGQGDNQAIRTPIDPVEAPAELKALRAKHTVIDSHETSEDGAVVLAQITGIHFESNQSYKITRYGAIHILNRAGINTYNSLEFDYDPLSEQIYVNWLRVKNAADEIIATGNVNSYYVLDEGDDLMATQDQTLHVPVPGLEPGCVLEYAVTTQQPSAPPYWPYREQPFINLQPVRLNAIFATGDIDQLAFDQHPDVQQQKSADSICWYMEDEPGFRFEDAQQHLYKWLPMVAIADRRPSWNTIVAEYLDQLAEHFQLDPATRELAAKLTTDAQSPTDVINRLARYVQDEYNYQALEFGTRARIPNKAETTIRNRYGDCKDHALLLHQLLQAVGIHSHLALMATHDKIYPEMPSLDQFDHVVNAIETDAGLRFIDCTKKYVDLTQTLLYPLSEETLLLLDPQQPRLIQTDAYTGRAGVAIERQVEFSAATHAQVSETVTFYGPYATAMRASFSDSPPARHREVLQLLLSQFSSVLIHEATFSNLQQLDQPLTLQLRYRIDDLLHPLDDELVGRLPIPWASYYFKVDYQDDRRTPFENRLSNTFSAHITITLPESMKLNKAPESAQHSAAPFLNWKFDSQLNAAQPTATLTIEQAKGEFSADQYSAYHTATSEMLDALAARIHLSQR